MKAISARLYDLLELMLPRYCAACGEKLFRAERCLCACCIKDIPLTYFWSREHNPMADRFNEKIQRSLDGNTRPAEPYSFAVALYFYKGNYRNLSQGLKYDADIRTGRYISAALGRKVAASPLLADVDLIIPVPLHARHRWRRGYNQAEIIAREVAAVLCSSGHGCRVDSAALRRRRNTVSQVKLSGEDKFTNMQGAFRANPRSFPGLPVHILLVDDVFTSGSTLSECHRTLRRALSTRFGPEKATAVKISAATLAFVGE